MQESLQGSGEDFSEFRKVYRIQERNLQGSGEFIGCRRGVYGVQQSLPGLGEFTKILCMVRDSLQCSDRYIKMGWCLNQDRYGT